MSDDDIGPRRPNRALGWPRRDRELFFWTARQALTLLFLASFTVYSIVQMAQGNLVLVDHVMRAFELLSGAGPIR